MKAVGYKIASAITDEAWLVGIDLPVPVPSGRDLHVAVKAISVHPVDYKVRRSTPAQETDGKVLGWMPSRCCASLAT